MLPPVLISIPLLHIPMQVDKQNTTLSMHCHNIVKLHMMFTHAIIILSKDIEINICSIFVCGNFNRVWMPYPNLFYMKKENEYVA